MRSLKILFVTPEADPYAKTGGLADVSRALPRAIRTMGHDMRLVMPEYGHIPYKYLERVDHLCHFRTNVVWRKEYVGINRLDDGLPVYFIDNKYFFDRPDPYDNWDRHVQFAFFCRAVLEMLPLVDFQPDLIHCNDWQTGPLSIMLEDNYRKYDFYRDIQTVFTIHNLRYQGIFGGEVVGDTLGIDSKYWHRGIIRHDSLVNFMKMGIMGADKLTTVSESYAREITTPEYGEGLDYALRLRADDLRGIVNGIDYDVFNPETDGHIYHQYGQDSLEKKSLNKRYLQQEMGLPQDEEIPLVGMVSRLVEEKGLALLGHIADELMVDDLQLIVLGTGEPEYENMFRMLARRYPGKIVVKIGYDPVMARRIYAGSDLFLMPSRFEACGLSQLISFRYGTIPVVREVGGLKDTVRPFVEDTGEGYGFTFSGYNAWDMLYTIRRGLNMYQNNRKAWTRMVRRVMGLDFSWERSAQEYLKLYTGLCELAGDGERDEE